MAGTPAVRIEGASRPVPWPSEHMSPPRGIPTVSAGVSTGLRDLDTMTLGLSQGLYLPRGIPTGSVTPDVAAPRGEVATEAARNALAAQLPRSPDRREGRRS